MRKRVLISHPRVRPVGGGNAVAAWVLQTLRSDFEVTLATIEPVDHRAVNRSFGTSLSQGDFEVRIAPERHLRRMRWIPTSGALLELCLTMRWAQELDESEDYDVLFSTSNEMDFHRRGIQYVHYPWLFMPRPDSEMRWYHQLPGMLFSYRAFCNAYARATKEGLKRNLTIANSQFVADRLRKTYGNDPVVVYPPIPGTFADMPWEQRQPAMAAVGRVAPIKRWDMAMEIVESVRRRGHDLALTLIGHVDDAAYAARLQELAASRPWFRLLFDLDRTTLLAELAAHRYGIHAMQDEHFGIAPAELQRAGCILFVHNSGGPVEIVGKDPRLAFDGVADAVEKIVRVLEDQALERELRSQVAERRNVFSTDRFCESVHEIVTRFAQDPAARA
ncbi:MAG: glycosyltransferase [Acidobacteriia bacterium]|nr:glycosyltransferase [Terriglobia bacterium]